MAGGSFAMWSKAPNKDTLLPSQRLEKGVLSPSMSTFKEVAPRSPKEDIPGSESDKMTF